MNKDNSLFLETTIQGERIFGDKVRKNQIQLNLDGKRVCSSAFVLNQFKNTFLNSVIYYYNLLVDSENTQTALRRSASYRERIHKRITQIFATLCDEVENDKEAALERLETWIVDGLAIEFYRDIEEPLINKTSCCWVSGEPIKVGSRYDIKVYCRKNKPPHCSIEDFWNVHKDELSRLSTSDILSKSKDKELKKVCEVASIIKNGNDSPYGKNCHIYLSDALIAIESPKESEIYTTNKKHFEPICEVIGRKVYKEVFNEYSR